MCSVRPAHAYIRAYTHIHVHAYIYTGVQMPTLYIHAYTHAYGSPEWVATAIANPGEPHPGAPAGGAGLKASAVLERSLHTGGTGRQVWRWRR